MNNRLPNIIYIMTDDQGFGDLGCYGNPLLNTPNIDRLAETGMKCNEFHASAPWCLPSRYGLMTGNHPYRNGSLKRNKEHFDSTRTIPELLKARGYRTALLGKWHLGMEKGFHPLERGFDTFYGTEGSNDHGIPGEKTKTEDSFSEVYGIEEEKLKRNPGITRQNYDLFREAGKTYFEVALYSGRDVVECPVDQSLFTQRYTAEAVKIIEEAGQQPFFIYLAHNMPHVPIFASEQFEGRSKWGVYGDVIEELDWSVGEIVRALEKQGVRDDTLIVYTSDNGPWTMFKEFGGTAGVLRGEKATTWEGGHRVPAVINWPGTIAPRESYDFMVNVDMFATFAQLAQCTHGDDSALDSVSMADVLVNGAPSPREDFVFYINDLPSAYRWRDYKVHIRSIDRMRNPDTFAKEAVREYAKPLVYNVVSDVSERRDLFGRDDEPIGDLMKRFRTAHGKVAGTVDDEILDAYAETDTN